MNNVMLGAIDTAVTSGGVVSDVVNMPYDPGSGVLSVDQTTTERPLFIKTPDIIMPLETQTPEPIETPAASETPETPGEPSNKKNLLLFGIAGIVLAYLLIRKK
jgi:hypothetical protein